MLSEHDLEGQANTFLNQAPFSFDLSVMDLYLSLVCGGTLFSITKEDINEPRQLYQSLTNSNVSIWVSTPSFARMCLIEPTFSVRMLPNLRIFLFCGEILAPEVADELLKRFPRAEVWNTYGPTETTVATTSVRIDRQTLADYSPLPVGYPKPHSRIYVLGPDGNQVGEGEGGEIVITGPNVSPGYVNRPELTRRAFFEIEGQPAYRTGDLGHFDNGLLFFDGRMDSQIKLHGYRIEIGDIEANLRICNNIQDVAVLPAAKDGLPDYLVAFVILSEHQTGTDYEITRRLKKELSQRLPAYMVPRRFVFLSEFPMTTNGKVDRHKLSERIA
jgi:D-alanine--poly(phosphoribitol) ligase subunit 1